MPLSTTAQLEIVKIIGVTPRYLADHLAVLGSSLTPDAEAAIYEELTKWTTVGGKFTKIHPTAANYGVEIDPEKAKNNIRNNLLMLLDMPQMLSTSMGTIYANA
jgi:hypothetical protein